MHPWCCIGYSLFSHFYIVSQSVNISNLSLHSIVDKYAVCFQYFACTNAALNMLMRPLINIHMFSVSARCLCFASVETAKLFSKMVVPILTPTSSVWEFWLSFSLTQNLISSLFYIKASTENIVIFHSDFNTHDYQKSWVPFHMFIGYLEIFSRRSSVQVFKPIFSFEYLPFFLLVCRVLYTFWI